MARDNTYYLISHWDFNEGSGTTLGDIVDTNDGTINGSVAWTTGIGTGGALEFSGDAGERVEFAREISTSANQFSDPYEYVNFHWLIKIRFKTTSKSGRALWTHTYSVTPNDPQPCIYVGDDGKVRCVFGSTLVQAVPEWYWSPSYVEADTDVSDGEWHEVAWMLCHYDQFANIALRWRGYMWLDGQYIDYVSAQNIIPGTSGDHYFWLGAGLLDKTWPGVPDGTRSRTDPWTGTVADIKAYWWNATDGNCAAALTEAEDLFEYTKDATASLTGVGATGYVGSTTVNINELPPVANALMFSCNT